MKKTLITIMVSLLAAPVAYAVPGLQLFIDGATYDWGSQSWVISDNEFDLYVVSAKTSKQDVFVSIALGQNDNPDDVMVDFDGKTIDPGDWVYGYAPYENHAEDWDGGQDLPRHGIFPTHFTQVNAGDYGLMQDVGDVQPDEDGNFWNPATGEGDSPAMGEARAFHVTVGGSFSLIHFDAFTLNPDGTIDQFAPFSHDASVVPEPGTILLLGTGLIGVGAFSFRRRKR
jgi:hypothetical protein